MKKLNKFEITILIPVFHNEDKIFSLKKEIYKHLSNYKFFICFVDDSDNNKTIKEIDNNFRKNYFVLKRNKKEKYSTRFSASIDGFRWIEKNVNCEYIVEIDSDLAHHPKDFKKGLNLLKIGNCDLVIGSKYHKNSIVKNRKYSRVLISKLITSTCKIMFDKNISDYSNTFRFYNMDLVKKFINKKVIFKSPIGHLNNLLYIIRSGHRIKDIPTNYIERDRESAIQAISLIRYFVEFIKCIFINKLKK